MTDAARAAIEQGLASSDPEDVHDAIIDIGKQRHTELVGKVVPYLSSRTGFLRAAAVKTLAFYLHLPAHKADAIRLLELDPDEDVREAAAMGLAYYAMEDRALLQQLVRVATHRGEQDIVRAAAFLSALDAAGLEPGEFPKARALPDFDAKADWALLARVLTRAGQPVPPEVTERVQRAPARG